jgi:short-subunit dehydrogenase
MIDFKDRWVLVTGAAHGIGTGFVRRFLRQGARLILVDVDAGGLERVFKEEAGGGEARHRRYVVDLSSAAERERLFQTLASDGIELDVLVNNAGIGYRSDLVDTPWPTLLKIIEVDVIAPTHLIRMFLPGMKARRRGAIINLSSTGAFCGANQACVYTGGKAYVMNFTEGLDMELYGSGVRVISAHPGATDTNFWQASGWANSNYNARIKMMSGDATANEFVDALVGGRKRHIAGLRNRLMVFFAGFIPREMLKKMAVAKYE